MDGIDDIQSRATHDPDAGSAELVIGLVLALVMLALLAMWPYTKQYLPGLADPISVQLLGPIERVTYVGGFQMRTQVEVGSSAILLRGAVEIRRGELVVRRTSGLDEELCEIATDRCHEIISR